MMRNVGIPVGRHILLASALLLSAGSLAGQEPARVSTEENFRREPNGEVLGRLHPGARLDVISRQDNWLEVDAFGWLWEQSLQRTDRDDFDMVVSAAEGENLRATPSGEIVGRVGRGTFFRSGSRQPGWVEVTRRGWIWAGSVEVASAPAATPGSSNTPSSASATPATRPGAQRPSGVVRLGGQGAAVLTAPDGDTLAVAVPRADLEVTARDGNWARVRLEGWAWLPEEAGGVDEDEAAITPEDLVADPSAYRGRIVSWALQFISFERAEAVRTDFREGEPFLLTRFGGAEGPFVYVALSEEWLEVGRALLPLERLSVTGRIRTGRSALTNTPILDIVALERIRSGR